MNRILLNSILFLLFIAFASDNLFAADHLSSADTLSSAGQAEEKKEFDTGEFIFSHIQDDYGWHLFTYNHHHVSIPLPVILYSKRQGWNIFFSHQVAHHQTHNGFKIAQEGPHKNKIVEVNESGEFVARPLDISITKNVLAIFLSCILLVVIFVSIARSYQRKPNQPPSGLQSLMEPVILFIRDDVARDSIGEKHYERFTPALLTIFFFILLNNLLGLVPFFPGGANVTGNITVTMALALVTFVITTFTGNKNYWAHIFNAPGIPWWLKVPLPLIPVIELFGVLIKPFVLMIRLFANITAGHIIILGFFSLIFIFGNINDVLGLAVSPVSVIFAVFMSFLELLVAFIQAYVFTVLSAIYFGMAVAEDH
ncbi:MAG: F0F1 ATP synthase subunit A [Bacteroidales bacterium]|jgi:F-type H+-transporting ATPase subunit a|nr:F0F1 ATP synthase subunit A [Bacteroidales bacterium]